jgi:predicted nucleotidyltransferase
LRKLAVPGRHVQEKETVIEVGLGAIQRWFLKKYSTFVIIIMLDREKCERDFMIDKSTLEEVKRRLIEAYNPVAIYVFGSYAWGTPTEESDLDLLVVIDESDEKSYKRPVVGYRALRGLDISKDLIVKTKDEFENSASNITTLVYKIKKSGKLIYARA